METTKLLKADNMMATGKGSMFEDIVIEILSKLPVKSLLRFRCVSKSWYELFGSPSFISKHQKDEHNTRLIVRYSVYDHDGNRTNGRDFISLFHDETLADVSLREEIIPLMPRQACLSGPFEGGLFCLISKYIKEIGIWNFATRDYTILPQLIPDSVWSIFGVGLGLDKKINCSKLVCTMTTFDYDQNHVRKSSDSSQVAVYSFSTNSWRNFQCLELRKYKFEFGDALDGTYHNGACYWLVKAQLDIEHPHYVDYYVILSFDMGNEVFQEIQPPDCRFEKPICYRHKAFGVHNDSLSYLIFDEKKSCFDIWTMNKESHNYNWAKQFTVTAPFIANDEELEVFYAIGFWKNGGLFLVTDARRMFLYDPTAQEKFKDLQLNDDVLTASTYLCKESLFNIKGK